MFNFKERKIEKLSRKLNSYRTARQSEQVSAAQIAKEVQCYIQLADIYEKLKSNKAYPYAGVCLLEALRQAADLEDAAANFKLGAYLLEEAKFRQRLEEEKTFSNQVNQIHLHALFKEAHAYLKKADELDHIEAKRLRGLCLINGWGHEVNQAQGFEMIVESIEKEGSWDRVPEIFRAAGLNKPEFFATIMSRRLKG